MNEGEDCQRVPDVSLLLSVRAGFARLIFEGRKTVEIRRRFSAKWAGHRVCVYASRPVQSLIGQVRIGEIIFDTPEAVWQTYHGQIGCTKAEYDAYTQGAERVFAITLNEVTPYVHPVSLEQLRELTGQRLTPPLNYYVLANHGRWARAVAMFGDLQDAAAGGYADIEVYFSFGENPLRGIMKWPGRFCD